jgi:hypothetical protein
MFTRVATKEKGRGFSVTFTGAIKREIAREKVNVSAWQLKIP